MNDYHKMVLALSDEVRAQRKRRRFIEFVRNTALQIAIAAVATVIGGLILAYLNM